MKKRSIIFTVLLFIIAILFGCSNPMSKKANNSAQSSHGQAAESFEASSTSVTSSTTPKTSLASVTSSTTPKASSAQSSQVVSIVVNSNNMKPLELQLVTNNANAGYDYVYYLPDEYDGNPSYKFPLIIFLHGAGEIGADVGVLKSQPIFGQYEEIRSRPVVMVAPMCPSGRASYDDADNLNKYLDYIISTYRIDKNRIYVTGYSMGARALWEWAYKYPNRFAALIPVAGGIFRGNPQRYAPVLKNIPIWAFNGKLDDVLRPNEVADSINAIISVGGNPKFTIIEDANHSSIHSAGYATEDLFEWIFKQRKP